MDSITFRPLIELPSNFRDIIAYNYVGTSPDPMKEYESVLVFNGETLGATIYTTERDKFSGRKDTRSLIAACQATFTADHKLIYNRYGGYKSLPQKIYIAGSFSTPEQRKELEEFIEVIRKRFPSSELFIPMEHFVPGGNDKDSNGNYIMPNEVWGRKVFEMDLEGLRQCDAVANLYRGHISGTGTSWELGYAYATGKYIIQSIPDSVKVASVMCYNCANTHIGNKTVEQK